jgi:hypothetical protein
MQATKQNFPRILFVNDFSPDSLTLGDLIRQLLLGYPVEKIACSTPNQICMSADSITFRCPPGSCQTSG